MSQTGQQQQLTGGDKKGAIKAAAVFGTCLKTVNSWGMSQNSLQPLEGGGERGAMIAVFSTQPLQ